MTPYIKEKYKLRESFFVDYKKWCTDVSGEVLEFKFILESLETSKQNESETSKQNELSNNYLIGHFWEIHNTIRMGHKWMGKVEKDSKNIRNRLNAIFVNKKEDPYEYLHRFIDFVDVTWHDLKNEYIELAGTHETEADFRKILVTLSMDEDKMKEISERIILKIKKNNTLTTDNCNTIVKFLRQQVP